MPKSNCPQSESWCPHFNPSECQDVDNNNAPCVHVRAILASNVALVGIMALISKSEIPFGINEQNVRSSAELLNMAESAWFRVQRNKFEPWAGPPPRKKL